MSSEVTQSPRQLLEHDHEELGHLLDAIINVRNESAVETTFAQLDLFWARLAVHIRAEHLHLFPTLLGTLKSSGANSQVSLAEAESMVAELRADHDFFMRQLASAVALVRNRECSGDRLTPIRTIVRAVKLRLEKHNEIEETQIYPLTTKILNEQQQRELALQIRPELIKQPKRFTEEFWREGT